MQELEQRCIEAFPRWLQQLGDDVRSLLALIGRSDLPAGVRLRCMASVNYLLKSIDLIPDGIEDLGFMDDAFVLRVGARQALAELAPDAPPDSLARLAAEADLVEEFLGPLYAALDAYVARADALVVRGRSAVVLLEAEELRSELAGELRAWADAYMAPAFTPDEKDLLKLKAFLATKLTA
jgi:uncharacterized membrane protein YkvA (DUF1232 family)